MTRDKGDLFKEKIVGAIPFILATGLLILSSARAFATTVSDKTTPLGTSFESPSGSEPQQVITQVLHQISPDPTVWIVFGHEAARRFPGLHTAASWFPQLVLDDASCTTAVIQLAQKSVVQKIHYYGTPDEIKAGRKGARMLFHLGDQQFTGHRLATKDFTRVVRELVNSLAGTSKNSIDWKVLAQALEAQPQPRRATEPSLPSIERSELSPSLPTSKNVRAPGGLPAARLPDGQGQAGLSGAASDSGSHAPDQELPRTQEIQTLQAQRQARVQLESEFAQLKQKSDSLQTKLTQIQKTKSDLENELAHFGEFRLQAEQKTAELNSKLQQAQNQLRSKEKEIGQLEKRFNQSTATQQESYRQIGELKHQFRIEEEKLGQTQKELATNQASAQKAAQLTQELKSTIDNLEARRKETAQLKYSLRSSNQKLFKALKERREIKGQLEKERLSAKQKNESLYKEISQLQKTKSDWEKKLRLDQLELEKARKEHTELQNSQKAKVELENQLRQIEKVRTQEQTKVSQFAKKLDEQEGQLKVKQEQVWDQEKRVSDLEQKLAAVIKEREDLKKRFTTKEERRHEVKSQLERIQKRSTGLEEALKETQEKLEQITQQSQQTKAQFEKELTDSRREKDAAQAALTQFQSEQATLQKQLEMKGEEERDRLRAELLQTEMTRQTTEKQLNDQILQLNQRLSQLKDELSQTPPRPTEAAKVAAQEPIQKQPKEFEKSYSAFTKLSQPLTAQVAPEKIPSPTPLPTPRSFVEVSRVKEEIGFVQLSVKEAEWATPGSTVLLTSQGQPVAEVELVDIDQSGVATGYLSRKIDPKYTIQLGDIFRAQPFLRTSSAHSETSDEQQQ